MASQGNRNRFPDFFTTKGSIPIQVTPLQFEHGIYYQASVVTEASEPEFESKRQLKPYLDNDDEMLDCADMEENYDIIVTKSGKFQTSFYVPSSVHSFIIGAKGSKLKALQKSTSTVIKIPRINEKGDVIVVGDTERKVASARTQIMLIVEQRKERMPPTHFISIPIDSDDIRENLLKFQNAVLENPSRGVTKSIFQKAVKVHLTVVMLKLLEEEEIAKAKDTLKSCYDEYISSVFEKNKKHKVTIKGLEIMNDDPSSVNVLYAKVQMNEPELTEKLQQVCDRILTSFHKAGLSKKEYDRVKLHMTVMNSSFRDSDEKRMPFDARVIMDQYKDFNFGVFELRQLDLCIRGTTTSSTGAPKYYDTALTIPIQI